VIQIAIPKNNKTNPAIYEACRETGFRHKKRQLTFIQVARELSADYGIVVPVIYQDEVSFFHSDGTVFKGSSFHNKGVRHTNGVTIVHTEDGELYLPTDIEERHFGKTFNLEVVAHRHFQIVPVSMTQVEEYLCL